MGKESLANGKRHVHVQNGDETLGKQAKAGVRPGDVMWIRLRGTSWWPAQVVDEKGVSDSIKPQKGKSGQVLVRLYGTYKYSYLDPTSYLEFDNGPIMKTFNSLVQLKQGAGRVLKRHKGSHKEIIQKGLKQDLSLSQSGRSKMRSSKGKGQTKRENGNVVKEVARPTKRTTEKQDGGKKKIRPNSPSSDVTPLKSGESVRRLKVMQGLGLTAPSGSPFLKNGQTLPILQ